MVKKEHTIQNKTRLYLSNIFTSFASKWVKDYICQSRRIKDGWVLCNTRGFFRGDLEYYDMFSKKDNNSLLFVVVDINGEWDSINNKYRNIYSGREQFNTFLRQFRKTKTGCCYDYPYGNPYTSNLHVFVFDMTEFGYPKQNWSNSIKQFDLGIYSKMYSPSQLSKMRLTKDGNIWKTLTGMDDKEVLKERIKQEFGHVKSKNIPDVAELDFPPLLRNEMLNYGKLKNKVYGEA